MYLGTRAGTKEFYLLYVQQEVDDFINFYQYADNKIQYDKSKLKSELNAEFDMFGQFAGFSGPTDEIDKLYSAPSILYSSIFIALYSFFEIKLTSLINEYTSKKILKLSLTDLKADNDINRVEKYLEKVLGINLSDIKPMFINLHEYRKIRNAFVHHAGLISKGREGKELFTKIQQEPSFSFYAHANQEDSGYISMKDSVFVSEFTSFIPSFLGEIFDKLYPPA